MNIAETLDRNQRLFPDHEAIIFEGRTWTYREFWETVNRAANAFEELGVRQGDKVCLFLSNCPQFLFAYYACQKLGAIAVSISGLSKAAEVEYMVNDCDGVLLVTQEELLENVPVRDRVPALLAVLSADRGGDRQWDELLQGRSAEFATRCTDRNDGAAILYTSGTTGKPKGVVLTHANVVFNSTGSRYLCDVRPEDRAICFLPIYHVFSQNFICNTMIEAAATVVMHKKFDLDKVLESLEKDRITRWYAVPAIYIRLLEDPRTDKALANVRYCFSAATSMPGEVARKWYQRFGLKIDEGYGLSETSPSTTYNHEFKHKEGSVGTPVANVEVRITGEDGAEMPRGVPGEIWIRGPHVMKGYYGKPEATAETIVDGWLRSGDIGYMDEEGYIFLVDRLKDMINSSGLKVWPREVEEVLYTHPNVRECSVIGVPDPVYGESVKAVVSLVEPGKTSESELKEFCSSELAAYKVPRFVAFIDEFPKTASGKILKRELKDRFAK